MKRPLKRKKKGNRSSGELKISSEISKNKKNSMNLKLFRLRKTHRFHSTSTMEPLTAPTSLPSGRKCSTLSNSPKKTSPTRKSWASSSKKLFSTKPRGKLSRSTIKTSNKRFRWLRRKSSNKKPNFKKTSPEILL